MGGRMHPANASKDTNAVNFKGNLDILSVSCIVFKEFPDSKSQALRANSSGGRTLPGNPAVVEPTTGKTSNPCGFNT